VNVRLGFVGINECCEDKKGDCKGNVGVGDSLWSYNECTR
jgi:hypothetical protein